MMIHTSQMSLRAKRSNPCGGDCFGVLRTPRNDAAWLVLSAFLLVTSSFPIRAHEGHDHGPAPAAAQSAAAPSLGGRSERFEIVARQVGDDLVVTIDRIDSNAPADAALVSVQSEGKTALLRQIGPGTFAAKAALLGPAGSHDITIVATLDGREERVAGSLVTAATAGGAPAPHRTPTARCFWQSRPSV